MSSTDKTNRADTREAPTMTDNTENERTRVDRMVTAVGWWTPELVGAIAAAGAAWTIWTPLLVITVALLLRIAAEPIIRRVQAKRSRERHLRKVVEQAQLEEARREQAAAHVDDVDVPEQIRRASNTTATFRENPEGTGRGDWGVAG